MNRKGSLRGNVWKSSIYNEEESWLWNAEVHQTLNIKIQFFKRYQQKRPNKTNALRLYGEASEEANNSVAIAKAHAFEELYEKNRFQRRLNNYLQSGK